MAKTFLRSSPARRLVVEVDWVEGREPSNDALGHLGAVIRSVVSKPGGVVVQRGSAFPAEAQRYSLQKIADVERRRRANRSSGDTATIWIAYLNGELAENEDALGVAFAASSVVIFRDQIDRATSAILLAVEIERAVIVHEAGHLLALVNIGYRSKINHEDAAHPNHSNNQESVMYWAVDSVSIRDLLGGGPPENFDAADRADLAMLRGG